MRKKTHRKTSPFGNDLFGITSVMDTKVLWLKRIVKSPERATESIRVSLVLCTIRSSSEVEDELSFPWKIKDQNRKEGSRSTWLIPISLSVGIRTAGGRGTFEGEDFLIRGTCDIGKMGRDEVDPPRIDSYLISIDGSSVYGSSISFSLESFLCCSHNLPIYNDNQSERKVECTTRWKDLKLNSIQLPFHEMIASSTRK